MPYRARLSLAAAAAIPAVAGGQDHSADWVANPPVSHPCVEAGKFAGVYYEASSSQWSWSPTGEYIAYDRAIGDVSQIRILRLASREERCVTSGEFHDTEANWSPDGRIAFVRGRGSDARIHMLRLDDGSLQPVTDGTHRSEYPTFSPDGSALAYVRYTEGGRRRFVVVRDLATGEERTIFDSPFGLNNLNWTPDGTTVLFFSIDDDGWNDLYEARSDGSRVRRVTDNTVTDSYSADYHTTGARMVYGQGAEVSPFHRWFNYDLYEQEIASGAVRRLTWAFNADDRASYSPDGGTIGFVSRRSGYAELFLMDRDGGNLRQLTRQPDGELTGVIRRDGLEAGEAYYARVTAEDGGAVLFGDRAATLLAHRFLAAGDPDAAVSVARLGVETHPSSSWIRTALGRALLAAGDAGAAARVLRESLALDPIQYQLVFALGFEGFMQALDSIPDVYRTKPAELLKLTEVLMARGELLASMSVLRRLDSAHPDDPDVIAGLADMKMRLGDSAGARADYRRVLDLDPTHAEARLHLRRIAEVDSESALK